jgi:transposase
VEVLHARCAGLDVHKDVIVACARIVEGGSVRHELKSFATLTRGLLELSDWLESHGCTAVAMEATGVYWKPAWQVLEGHFDLILGNAAHIKNVPGRKTDANDAQWLSDLVAHGLIRSSFVPPEPVQDLRDLTRTRKQLAREVVQHTNRVQKVLESANIKLTGLISDVLGKGGRAILDALVAGETDPAKLALLAPRVRASSAQLTEALRGRVREHHRFMLELHLGQIDALRASIEEIEARLDSSLATFRDAIAHVITIPGVNPTLAWTIVSEIGTDMTRFQTDRHLRSWACICPRNDESAGKRRSTRIRRGCKWLKEGLIQAAWSVSRMKHGYLSAQFHRIRARRGAKKAAVAVAGSILTIAYCLIRDNTEYKDLGGHFFNLRDKQKTAKRLLRRLEQLGVKVQVQTPAPAAVSI